jgi:hypothetical protein
MQSVGSGWRADGSGSSSAGRFVGAALWISASVACHGSASSGRGSISPSDAGIPRHYTGRLLREVVLELPEGFLATLSASERAAIEAESGGKIDAAQNAIVHARTPYQGRYIKVGDGFVLTDKDGYFRIPDLPAGMTSVDIYRETQDANLDATFPLDPAGFDVASDAAAPAYVKKDRLAVPGDMNPPDGTAPPLHHHGGDSPPGAVKIPDGCSERCDATAAAVVKNQQGCCQDYDGAIGDGLPRERGDPSLVCRGKAVRNFLGSTCERWSDSQIGTACQNESAYQCKFRLTSRECSAENKPTCKKATDCTAGTTCFGGQCLYPACYLNHKWRNCQNMDPKELGLAPYPQTTVAGGGKVTITLINNTEANETRILGLNGSNGTLTLATPGPGLNPGPALYVTHYNTSQLKHYELVKLTYTAPPNPKCTPMPVVLTFDAANPTPRAPLSISLTILVKGAGKSVPPGPGASTADSCPVDNPSPTGALGDVLTVSGVVAEWAKGDAIAPGPGNISGTMVVGQSFDQIREGLGQGAVDSDGSFGFVADCTGGAGPCAASVQASAALCGGINASDPRLRIVKLDAYLIDSLFVEGVHARVGGGLVLARQPPRTFLASGRGDIYTYFWADRSATVKGSCGPVSFDLSLVRGWNSIHRNGSGLFRAEDVPSDARWYFLNTLTAGP